MRNLSSIPICLLLACVQTPRALIDSDTGNAGDSSGPWSVSTTEVSNGCGMEFIWTPGIAGLNPPHYLEDDTIQIEVVCSKEVDASLLSITPLNLPTSAQWNPKSQVFTYPTDGTLGGRVDLLFTAKIDGDDAFPETRKIAFWIGDNPSAINASSPVPERYIEEWGLPVFHVESDGNIGTSYESATITFDGTSYPAEIQKRGAVSIYYPKNSFGLRFDEPELDLESYGIEQRRDHLVLITPFDDNSYVRQRLIYELWAEMARYWGASRLTPRTFFAVMYLDGEYHGVYTASDRIDDEFAFHMGLSKDGNLYKAVNHDANFYLTTNSGVAKTTLAAGFEKKEGEPESGDDAFQDLIELVETTGSSSPHDFNLMSDQWIQTDEFMDWYHLIQISVAYDSAGKNAYLYHDPTNDSPFRYVPWDFNHSWGQDWRTFRVSSATDNDLTELNAIFAHFLWGNPEELMERYRSMRQDGPLADSWLLNRVAEYWDELGPAVDKDWNKWRNSYQSYSSWSSSRSASGDWTTPAEEREYLEHWIVERGAVMDSFAEDF